MMSRYNTTERLGINAVEQIILKELKWIFREQLIADMGIDAQIEVVCNGVPTGQLLALQIKNALKLCFYPILNFSLSISFVLNLCFIKR